MTQTPTGLDRRQFMQQSLDVGGMSGALTGLPVAAELLAAEKPALEIAPFRFDVSPPEGHPLCGGWIKPVVGYDDRLEAIGFVLRGAGAPVVICAVDWTGILNRGHLEWRTVLAQAAGTTPNRVAVQCVHQHNAPFVCPAAEAYLQSVDSSLTCMMPDFFAQCLDRGAKAITTALREPRPVTHVAHGQAKVERVASNRRFIGPDGKLSDWRGSASRKPEHKALPEGLIDPFLKTVAFYHGEQRLVACHYYATHPMSYYGDGRVCSEFVGLARKRRQQEDPSCTHIYFTGASGNIAAGKYNDGTPEARVQLTERMYAALVASDQALKPQPVVSASWTTAPIVPPCATQLVADELAEKVANKQNALANRIRPAMMLSFLRRCEAQTPIILSGLHVNDASLVHLPAESFLEYQLRAQQARQDRFVAVAAYGDGGPWYIPIREAYPQGGYEVSVANCDPAMDEILTGGIQRVLQV
ncbi:MAG: hypothetical protein JNM18_21470 [Planctomycetaceae bacterium]|nr:hypothetical protein [Planctomycetaceae bacterium]